MQGGQQAGPAPRQPVRAPAWVPPAHIVAPIVLLTLVIVAAIAGGVPVLGGGEAAPGEIAAVQPIVTTSPQQGEVAPTAAPAEPTGAVVSVATAPTGSAAPTGVIAPTEPAAAAAASQGGLLPGNRIVTFYGHPYDANMGVIGQYGDDMNGLITALRTQAAAVEAADPSRPVIPAIELITSVAQSEPGADGTYLLHTDRAQLDYFAKLTADNGMILILDVQIGHSNVQDEIELVRPWLELPNVHLALDPEFAMAPDQVPGQAIGGIDASDVAYAQQVLAEISAEKGIPPKVLIVHRFTEGMIRNAEQLTPVGGVQLVIDFDGFGDPATKAALYNVFITDDPVQFGGIKLFFKQDDPILTPQELMELGPPPDVVIYQ